jgi:hypothetical protein
MGLLPHYSQTEVPHSLCADQKVSHPPKKIALIEAMNPVWVDLSCDWYDYEPADYRRALDRMDS